MSGAQGDTESGGKDFPRQDLGPHQDQEPGWEFIEKTIPAERNGAFPAVGLSVVSSLHLKLVSVARRRCPFLLHTRWVATDDRVLLRGVLSHEHVTWLFREKNQTEIIADLPTNGDFDSACSLDTIVHLLGDVDVAQRAVEETLNEGGAEANVGLGIGGVPTLSRRDYEEVVFDLCTSLPPTFMW